VLASREGSCRVSARVSGETAGRLHDRRSPTISPWATFRAVGKQTFSRGGSELYARARVGKHHPGSGGKHHKVLRCQSSSGPGQMAYTTRVCRVSRRRAEGVHGTLSFPATPVEDVGIDHRGLHAAPALRGSETCRPANPGLKPTLLEGVWKVSPAGA
jgi:hypothetical protein